MEQNRDQRPMRHGGMKPEVGGIVRCGLGYVGFSGLRLYESEVVPTRCYRVVVLASSEATRWR